MKWDLQWTGKAASFFKAWRWPILVLLVGICLMLLPDGHTPEPSSAAPTAPAPETQPAEAAYCAAMEERLEKILSQIEGAGTVRVMLTLKSGSVTRYQTDNRTQQRTEGENTYTESERKTVLIARGSSYNEAAVTGTDCPSFRGALIVSPGAEDAAVRYRLLSAAAALLGLGADEITVVKMK